jgi:hypothetical protein
MADAIYPVGKLVADVNGFLYGASYYGGAPGWGSVFVFRPYFPDTAIKSTSSSSKYATLPANVFAYPNVIGQGTWYAYGRVLELAATGDLSYDLLSKMPAAFALRNTPAIRWPLRLPGHWIATGNDKPLPKDRRRIGLLAVYAGPPPNGHIGFVEEISVDKRQYRMSQFNRSGHKEYGNEWYYFDSADGQPDGSLGSPDANISQRWYPRFFDPSDPNW